MPTRELLESWILAGVVEPNDKVARPGESTYTLIRDLADVSDAVETGSVVHGPRTVPTHPPVFAVVDGPNTEPPPVPGEELELLDLEPLEGDTLQDAPIVDEGPQPGQLGVAKTRAASVEDDLTGPDYPSESPTEDRLPPVGATLDEMLPDLASAAPVSEEAAPRTGRVAVAPTTLAPVKVGGSVVPDQAVDPRDNPASQVPYIGADGEVLERDSQAPRTGRIAVGATDLDAAQSDLELQATHPAREGIPDPTERPTQPSVPRVAERPDVSLRPSDDSPRPSALDQTLNKVASAPAATEALSRPIQRAGALGGVYSEEVELRALKRERRRTVLITVTLLALAGGGAALWWIQSQPEAASDPSTAQTQTEVTTEKSEAKPAEVDPAASPEEPAAAATNQKQAAEKGGSVDADQKAPAAPQEEQEAAASSEESPSDEERAAREEAEKARAEAVAAIDEEIESESTALAEKPKADPKSSKKKSKKSKKSKSLERPEKDVSGKSYESLIRAAKKLKRKSPSKALALYKQALAKRPSSPDALSNVGRLQMKAGQTAAAITTFKKCRKAMPRYTPCMYWHGRALEKAGRRSEAMKAYENYLDVNPDGSQSADVRKRLSR